MKLIIVDDEPAVRGSIRMLIDPEMLGVTMVEEASDGQEALAKLEKTRFDVMITDMRMPGMDGIGLLNSISNENLPSTIVVSAWHDFEYMRLAMQKHAIDYLLKPIKQAELVAALRRAAYESGKQSAQAQNDRFSSLWWPISGYPKKEFYRAFETIPLDNAEKQIFYLRIIGFKNVLKQKYGNSKELMYYHVERSIGDFLARTKIRHDMVILGETAEMIVILHDANKSDIDLKSEIERIILLQTAVCCICELSATKLNTSEVFAAYEALRQKTGKRAWDPISGQLLLESAQTTYSETILTRIQIKVKNAVQSLDMVLLSRSIKTLENIAFEEEKPSLSSLEALISAYLNGLTEGLNNAGTTLTDALEEFDGFLALSGWIGNRNTLMAWVEAMGKACIDHCFMVKRKRCGHAMKAMLDYVERNYTLDIGLDDLSKQFHLSREHISRIFKKETGENFIVYLTHLRMKKATELIGEAKQSMQMVAESIGFNDASYFSRSFKKYFGISPEEYKRKNLC